MGDSAAQHQEAAHQKPPAALRLASPEDGPVASDASGSQFFQRLWPHQTNARADRVDLARNHSFTGIAFLGCASAQSDTWKVRVWIFWLRSVTPARARTKGPVPCITIKNFGMPKEKLETDLRAG